MLQRHYPVPVVIRRKICKMPLYSCNRLLIRRKTLTSEEEIEFLQEIRVYAFSSPHTCYMPYIFRPPRFINPNNIW